MDIQSGDMQETATCLHMLCDSFEHSYNEEMRKHTLRGKLFAATMGKNVNNRIAVFEW